MATAHNLVKEAEALRNSYQRTHHENRSRVYCGGAQLQELQQCYQHKPMQIALGN